MLKPRLLIIGEDGIGADGTPLNVMSNAYGEAVAKAGGLPIWGFDIRAAKEYCDLADALLLTDGLDLHVYRFGEIYRDAAEMHSFSRTRDDLDFRLCQLFYEAGKPIMGIGRGMQVLNVALQGTLYKDLNKDTSLRHPGAVQPPAQPPLPVTFGFHPIQAEADTLLSSVIHSGATVTSCHKRAVKTLAPGMKVAARAEDGVIEAIAHQSKPVFGVQWNPEREVDGVLQDGELFAKLIELCQKNTESVMTQKKPIFLISGGPAIDREFFSLGHVLNKTYSAAFAAVDAVPISPLDMNSLDEYMAIADGLVLSGSHAYAPAPGLLTPEMQKIRTPDDHAMIRAALKAQKPIFGICLGMQEINVVLGGDLVPNFKLQDGVEHMMTEHTIKVDPNSLLADLFGSEFWINSRHNVKVGHVAEHLRITAYSKDGVVEACEHETLPIYGFQWHPERMRGDFPEPPQGPDMTPLFAWFADFCIKAAKQKSG
ncbi:MAG: gamma-glutamyl-gamma-aminobutyrate hydrolase family protein [Negativicutes bacterium]|nr:gamma-glutamyl-gamma-aminobutyrate hydrolase family protein [Negativicutes bacterium]